MRKTLLAAGLLLALPLPVAAQLFGGISEAQEIELGREAATMIEADLQLLDDQRVGDYVSRLGQALVARSGRAELSYAFTVVDSPEINAFALPGGFIYVNRGLIEAAENESELAGVLGHEIGHVVARHGVDQMQRAQIASLGLGVLGSLLGRGRAASIGNMAGELVAGGAFMKFSRDAEREADQLGARNESPDIKVGRSQRTGSTCAVSPAHLSSSNNHRLNTLRRLLAAAEQAPQPERGLRRRPSTEARKYCSGRSQKNP